MLLPTKSRDRSAELQGGRATVLRAMRHDSHEKVIIDAC